jgi:tetratricopeptide (TPR) repeat protein
VRSSPTFSYVGDGLEARRRAEQALRLSPFDPHLFYTQTALALAHYTLGDFAEAVAWGRKAMLANPLYTPTLRTLAASLGAAGRVDDAQAVGRALLAQVPAFRVGPFCDAYAFADPGRRAALAAHLRAAGLPE